MPKAPTRKSTRTSRKDKDPILSKPEDQNATEASPKKEKKKDGRDSHLYTDDNPKTTIHGTGFKDQAAAERTLKLIENRSLIYQFQTVNTLYNRAKHHPSMKKDPKGTSANTSDMRAAMSTFREWLDVTYPADQKSLRGNGFKPILSKSLIQRYLAQIQEVASTGCVISDAAATFAEMYSVLPKGKKLGNILIDDSKPTGHDWEKRRYVLIDELVPKGKEVEDAWEEGELWEEDGGEDGDGGEGEGKEKKKKGKKVPTGEHLQLIALGWSPVGERKLKSIAGIK